MSLAPHRPVTEILAAVETLRRREGLSRHELADRLGIPFETFRRWFQKNATKRPSAGYLSRVEAYLGKARDEDSQWNGVWEAICRWWQSQHRYASALELAREIGWEADPLGKCLGSGAAPPRLVVERLAESLRMPTPASRPGPAEAERRTERLKALLILLHEELAWFRDGPEQVRGVFRAELDPFDLGYLSSLLAMLSDEGKFKRWLRATSNRFASFERKGRRR